jgi:hypothetical protein
MPGAEASWPALSAKRETVLELAAQAVADGDVRAPGLVLEMSHAREDHRQTMLVSGADNFFISH